MSLNVRYNARFSSLLKFLRSRQQKYLTDTSDTFKA